MHTEIGVIKPRNDKDVWKPLEVRRGKEAFFLKPLAEIWHNGILILDF